MTQFQAALLMGQLEMLPELAARRARSAGRLSSAISVIRGVRTLPARRGITQETICCYVFQYRPQRPHVSRDLFVAALEAEGIPCDGRFYEPVYRSDLFYATPANCPQLRADYSGVRCPVSERAAYEESVWLPQFLLIGDERDVDDIASAVAKVMRNIDDLASADPSLADPHTLSPPQRPALDRAA